MTDDQKLPPGCVESPELTAPIVTATTVDDETVRIPHPELVGLHCEVQHPDGAGLPMATELGMIGFGVAVTDDGPVLLVQVMHPDGSVLTGFLRNSAELEAFDSCLKQACRTLVLALPEQAGEA